MSTIVRGKTGLRRLVLPSKATAGNGRTVPKQSLRAFTTVGFKKRNIGAKDAHTNYVKPKEENAHAPRELQRKTHTQYVARVPGAKKSESVVPPRSAPLLRYVIIVDDPSIESDEVRDARNYCTINGIECIIVDMNNPDVTQMFTNIVKQPNTNPMVIHIVADGSLDKSAPDTIHQLFLRRLNVEIRCLVICSNPLLDINKRHHFRAPHVQRLSLSMPLAVEASDCPQYRCVIDEVNAAV